MRTIRPTWYLVFTMVPRDGVIEYCGSFFCRWHPPPLPRSPFILRRLCIHQAWNIYIYITYIYIIYKYIIPGIYIYKAPLRVVVDLNSRGCLKLKRGEYLQSGVPVFISLCEVRWCCTAAAAAAPMLLLLVLYCAGAFGCQRKCWL